MSCCGNEFLENAEILTETNENQTQLETPHPTQYVLLQAKPKYFDAGRWLDGLAGLAELAGPRLYWL